jgi:D-threonate/D-erythronate kinase
MFAIIADDLTGAAEVAGVCLRYGLTVAFGVDEIPNGNADVWVIATDSRSLSSWEAVANHHRLVVSLKAAGVKEIFKKTDSVFRGHILAELDVLMSVTEVDTAVLQPANPAAGRCLVDGRYLINGLPLPETAFAGDPDFPATTADVKQLLQRENTDIHRVIHAPSETLTEIGIHVPDALTKRDLKRSVPVETNSCLFAGSAAFLSVYLEEVHGFVAQKQDICTKLPNSYLMVCGTKHPRSEVFWRNLSEMGETVTVFPEALLQEKTAWDELEHWTGVLISLYRQKPRLIVTQGQRPVSYPNASNVLKSRMAEVISRLLATCSVTELLLEGGATAFAILQKQGWKNLIPIEEWAPGIVRMQVKDCSGLYLTFKPGSYDWPGK